MYKIVIADNAKQQLKDLYNYIKRDSFKNAQTVKKKIISSIKIYRKIRLCIRLTNLKLTTTDRSELTKSINIELLIMYQKHKFLFLGYGIQK